jgi:hypothetical protein
MDIALYIIAGILIGAFVAYLITNNKLSVIHQQVLITKNDEINELNRQNSSLQAKVEAQANSLEEVRKAMVDTFNLVHM